MSSYSHRLTDLAAQLEERTSAFLRELESLDPARLDFHPESGGWSILDVGHHLMLIEKGILKMALQPRKPLSRSLRDRFGHLAVKAVLSLGIRVQAPSKAIRPTDPITVAELKERWLEVRSGIKDAFLASQEGEALFRHPFAGSLNGETGLEFLVTHFDHHMKQVDRVRRCDGFP